MFEIPHNDSALVKSMEPVVNNKLWNGVSKNLTKKQIVFEMLLTRRFSMTVEHKIIIKAQRETFMCIAKETHKFTNRQ